MGGVSSEDWRAAFYTLAKYVPGLGGPEGYNFLTLEDIMDMLDRVKKDLDARARAWRK